MEHRLAASVQAEQSVLGGIMLSNGKALPEVQDILRIDDFFRQDHRVIYRHLCELDLKDSPLDVVTVSESMNSGNLLEECGGLGYLATLCKDTPSAANIRAYAQIIRDRSIRRRLMLASRELWNLSEKDGEIEEILSEAQAAVLEIGNDEGSAGPRELRHWLPAWTDRLDRMSQSEDLVAGISTGFSDLDRKISGLQKQNLVVIAGRPSMGKTALAMNISQHVSMRQDLSVLVFSLEMSGDEIVSRMVSQVGRVPMERLMSGDMNDELWQKAGTAMSKLGKLKYLRVDEAASLMLSQIRSRSRRVKSQTGKLDLIVVDYLQLMGADGLSDTRAQQLADMTRGLKALAKELDVPVLALSQLNRDVEKRENKRPRLSDLKESGAIEQDADVVIFIYRDVVYNETTAHPMIAEVIVGKQRNGPTGTVLMNYFGEYTQFASLDTDSQKAFWENRHSTKRKKRGLDDGEF